MEKDRGIGKEGKLPWSLPKDMKFFKDLTIRADNGKQNVVIMGRKTWESIPERFRPLKDRINLVLSHNAGLDLSSKVKVFNNLDSALEWAEAGPLNEEIDQVFVIGGQQIFNTAIEHPKCKTLYITYINNNINCDTFFPPFEDKFTLEETSPEQEENNLIFSFLKYKNKNKA